MAPPVRKKNKFSSDNRRLISSTAIGDEHEQQQPMGSLMTSLGRRRSVRVAKKMNKRIFLKKIWICNDVWMDIFPSFDRPQLGLKLALLSPRFNALVDKHFDGKNELTIWRLFTISPNHSVTAPAPKLFVLTRGIPDIMTLLPCQLSDHPLPSKIRFECLQIEYIDHSVIGFLRANKQIFDRSGTELYLSSYLSSYSSYKHDAADDDDVQRIWDIFLREIWPIFATNIRHLGFVGGDHHIAPTILSDLNQLNSIDSDFLSPKPSLAGQALAKWLHTPTTDGQPKQLRCKILDEQGKWISNFKEQFLNATTSCVSYKIQFIVYSMPTPMVPFDSVNVRTQEKLTLSKASANKRDNRWIMKRCKIGDTTPVQWEHKMSNNLNNVYINLSHYSLHQRRVKAAKKGVKLCGSEI